MKKQVILAVFVAVICLGGAGAPGYSQSSSRLLADIPFDFHVGQATLPAGTYVLERPSNTYPQVLKIQNTATCKSALTNTLPGSVTNASSQAKLIFHRYGDDYFLAEFCNPYHSITYQLPKSREEKEIARNANGVKTEVVAQKR